MTAGQRPLSIRIEGSNLPGRTFAEHAAVHVGVQCRAEAADLVPGDAPEAVFDFSVDVLPAEGGGWDFRGPHVHGRRGERFLYLTWGDVGADGSFAMFRRAKLHLSSLDDGLIGRAAEPRPRPVVRAKAGAGDSSAAAASARTASARTASVRGVGRRVRIGAPAG